MFYCIINSLHMACGGFEVLFYPLKPKLATKKKATDSLSVAISY
jgi:hypothetical protein